MAAGLLGSVMSSREKTIATARSFAEQGRFDLAIREYERLLAAFPDDLRSRIKLGFLHVRSGDAQMAIELWLEVAHSFEQRGATAEASTVLQQVLRLDPDHMDALLWQAQLFASLGQPAESRRALEVAHKLLDQSGRVLDALRVLEDMVALDPGNVAICIRLGEAYAANDRKEEAVEILTRAVDVLRVAEWVDDFIRVAERLVWLKPDNVALSKELAIHYLRQRAPRSALQKLQRCYEADQSDPETLKLLADTFIDLREPEKGATILRVLADVFEQNGEPERADAVLDQAYRLDPESQPEEMEEEDWTWQQPVAADAGDLSPLEMSLQPSGPEEDAPRRFLPAITAEGRHGRLATSPEHRTVTTQELDLNDLIFLEQHHAAITQVTSITPERQARSERVVSTTELDLADLEEVKTASPVITEELVETTEELVVTKEELASDELWLAESTDVSTHERALNELEDLAGELSERYLETRPKGEVEGREKETVKYRSSPPRPRADPRTRSDVDPGDTRRSRRMEEPPSDTTEPRSRRGRRSRR